MIGKNILAIERLFQISLVLLVSCSSHKGHCLLDSKELLAIYRDRIIVGDTIDGVSWIRDKGTDTIRGGVYGFRKNGKLKDYYFMQTNKVFVYHEEYNENGFLHGIIGRPLVDREIDEVNIDSAHFSLYFSTLHRRFHDLKISVNGSKNFSPRLDADSLYSFMDVASFGVNTKGMNKVNIHIYATFEDDCTNQTVWMRDTISCVKNPHLGRADRKE